MRIERGDDPGPFSEPRDYVSYLRTLFRFRCAYCLTPDDQLGGEEGMKVDHFRPESRFPELRHIWSNLYYSCDVCNNRKSDHPREADEAMGCRFVNPCSEDPDDHFRMTRDPETGDFCQVTHRSDPAQYTIRRLHFNRRKFLRDFWRELDAAERKLMENLDCVHILQQQIGRSTNEIVKLLNECQTSLAEIRDRRPFPKDDS